MAACNDRHLI